MVEKLSAQQNVQLNNYLKQHPNTSRDAAIKLLFGNKERSSTSSKGLAVEHNTKDAYESKTIYLQSGRKVVYTKTKNGKFVYKYYGADGNPIKPEYFKKVEGNISINEAENSYTTTINGKSIKHKAKDPRKAQIDQNIAKLNKQEKSLKRAKKEQGFIGKRWDWFKNTAAGEFFNLDGSDKAQKQIDEERKLLTQLRDNPNAQIDPKKFEKITGQKYTKANLTKFQQGEFSSAKAMVDGYKEGQAIAVDVASDVTSGIVSFGIYAVAIAAAPVTGGASIAIGLAAAGVAGAATKIAVKAADTIGTNRKYDLLSKEAAGDALMGSVNGLLAPFTAGAGGAVAKTVAIRAGVQIVKETGKQATKQVLSQATKNAAKQGLGRVFKSQLKESIIHPNNYKLVGGTFSKRLAAYGAEGVVDGALSGGAYSGVETAKDGGSAGDILKATALGFGTGAIMGGVMSSAAHGKGIVTGNKGAGEVLEDGVAKAAEKTTTKGSTPKAQADAIENSVTQNTDDSLAPSGRGLARGTDNTTPTPKSQGAKTKGENRVLGSLKKQDNWEVDDWNVEVTPKKDNGIVDYWDNWKTDNDMVNVFDNISDTIDIPPESKVSSYFKIKIPQKDQVKKTLSTEEFKAKVDNAKMAYSEYVPRFETEQEKQLIMELHQKYPDFVEELLDVEVTPNYGQKYNFNSEMIAGFVELYEKSNNKKLARDVILYSKDYLEIHSTLKILNELPDDEAQRIFKRAKSEIAGQDILLSEIFGSAFDLYRLGINAKDLNKIGYQDEIILNKAIKDGQLEELLCTNFGSFEKNGIKLNQIKEFECKTEYQIKINDFDNDYIMNFTVDHNTGKVNVISKSEKYTDIIKTGNGIGQIGKKAETILPSGVKIEETDTASGGIKKVMYDADGKLIRNDEIKKSQLRRGESEITVTKPDKDGNLVTEKVGTVKICMKENKNGMRWVEHARKRVENPDGSISRQIKVFGKDRHGTIYKILDKDGNVELDIKRSHRKITENHYRSSHNGERFDIKYDNDGITVSLVEGTGAKERLVKPAKISFDELDPQLLDLYKQLPGDYLYKLKLMGVKVKYEPKHEFDILQGGLQDRSCYISSNKTITISERSKNNPEVFAHEYAHAVDDYLNLNTDSEYLKLSKQDWEDFSRISGFKEKDQINYYTQNLNPDDHNPDFELIAGVGQTIAGFSDAENFHQIGDAILFQNYSRTIAYVGKKLEMPLEEFAQAGRKAGADLDIAATRISHSAPTP